MKNRRFSTNISLYFETIKDMAVVTTEDEQKLVCDLSNGVISNELK